MQSKKSLRNRSYNYGEKYPLMSKIKAQHNQSVGRKQISNFNLNNSSTQSPGRQNSSPKLTKQKMKLRNVLGAATSFNHSSKNVKSMI
jgi:hypothetical protein